MFKDTTAAMLYHIFKRAGERKTKSLFTDVERYTRRIGRRYLENRADKIVLEEALSQLEAEGYCRKFELKLEHLKRRVSLTDKQSLTFRLKEFAEKFGVELTDDELSAVSRGLIADVFSALTGSDINVERAVFNEKRGDNVYFT